MTEQDAPKGLEIVAVAYEPADSSGPALLDLSVITEDESIRTFTLQGKAAKKLSRLQVGDYYTETA